ncbi:MAG: hypothetical protein IPJ65_16940 [Archangiaceae bacterium]|nr:hypothetical protein [Archangiaceae bacterium]
MSSLTFERSCTIPAANALPRVAQWFLTNGYTQVAKSANEVSLFYQAGSALSARFDEHRHRLSVRSDGRRITFDFGTGLSSGGLVIDSERKELERRVDAAMTGLIGVPPSTGARRCPACSTMAEPGTAECAVCGSHLT